MTKKDLNSNFLIQGSILAFAGILVRVIGLIYRIPLINILGDEGMGYYSSAYDIYSILLLLSSQSMPLAVSKLISERMIKNEYRNANKAFIGALIYALIIGLVFGLFIFLGADWLAERFSSPSCARALRVLGPTLLFVSIIGVFRGYFQGMGQMVPTAISQILEQIVNAIVSVVAAYQLYIYGKDIVDASEKIKNTNAASYGAAGGTLGTCMGAFAAFVILLFIYVKYKKRTKSKIDNDTTSGSEGYGTLIKVLVLTITPVLLSTTIYQIGNLIDNGIYGNIVMKIFNATESQRSAAWGIYSGRYKLLTTMPIAIASAMSLSIVPTIVASYTTKKTDEVCNKIDMAIKYTMLIAIPSGVGLSVLGGPINRLISPGISDYDSTVLIMIFSVFTVAFFSLSTISNAILQGIEKMKIPIINSAISLVLHLVLLPIMLIVLKMDLYAVVIGDFVFAAIICLLNARAINVYLNYKQERTNTFIKPVIASLIMGVAAYFSYTLFNLIFVNIGLANIIANDIAVMIAIIISVIVYFIILIKIQCIDEKILLAMPKGNLIISLCKKMHLCIKK